MSNKIRYVRDLFLLQSHIGSSNPSSVGIPMKSMYRLMDCINEYFAYKADLRKIKRQIKEVKQKIYLNNCLSKFYDANWVSLSDLINFYGPQKASDLISLINKYPSHPAHCIKPFDHPEHKVINYLYDGEYYAYNRNELISELSILKHLKREKRNQIKALNIHEGLSL